MDFESRSYTASLIERKAILNAAAKQDYQWLHFREVGREVPATEIPYEGSLYYGGMVGIHLIGKGGRYDFVHSSQDEYLTTLVIAHNFHRAWSTTNPYTNDNWDTVNATCIGVEQEFYELEASLLANYACTQCHAKTSHIGAWDLNGEFHEEEMIHGMKSDTGFELFGDFPEMSVVVILDSGLCMRCDKEKLNRWNRSA